MVPPTVHKKSIVNSTILQSTCISAGPSSCNPTINFWSVLSQVQTLSKNSDIGFPEECVHYKTKFRGFKVRKGLLSKIINSHNWGARGPEPTHIYTHTFCRLPPPLLASSGPIVIVVLMGVYQSLSSQLFTIGQNTQQHNLKLCRTVAIPQSHNPAAKLTTSWVLKFYNTALRSVA